MHRLRKTVEVSGYDDARELPVTPIACHAEVRRVWDPVQAAEVAETIEARLALAGVLPEDEERYELQEPAEDPMRPSLIAQFLEQLAQEERALEDAVAAVDASKAELDQRRSRADHLSRAIAELEAYDSEGSRDEPSPDAMCATCGGRYGDHALRSCGCRLSTFSTPGAR